MSDWRQKASLAKFMLIKPRLAFGRRAHILMISHMRSYSSLLGHIFGSHSEIDGYFEVPVRYADWLEFVDLRRRIYHAQGNRLDGRYLFNKSLHTRWDPPRRVFERQDFRLLFVLRQPENTVKSIWHMRNKLRHWGTNNSHEDVITDYVNRLESIAEIAANVGKRGRFLVAENIVEDTPSTLGALSDWLQLSEPLSKQYQLFALTGVHGRGDPSEVIKSGEVLESRMDYAEVLFTEPQLARAKVAYEACRAVCEQHLTMLGGFITTQISNGALVGIAPSFR